MAETVGLSQKKIEGCKYDLWNSDPMTKDVPRITPAQFSQKLEKIFSSLMEKSEWEAPQFTKMLPIFVFGPPGIGKSQIIESLATKFKGIKVETYIASTMDPTQVQGLPYPNRETKTTEWFPDQRFVDKDKKTRVYFFDELNMAPSATQAAFYRLILEGKLGNIDISHALRIGAGNRVSDYEGIKQMSLPLATRFEVYVMQPDINDWIKWAKNKHLNKYVIEYAELAANQPSTAINEESNIPSQWYCINPSEPALARATPRSWERVSQLLEVGLNTKEDIVGSLGEGPGSAFEKWYRERINEENKSNNKYEYRERF